MFSADHQLFGDERSFVQRNNIFELSAREKSNVYNTTKSGFDGVLTILEDIGYYRIRLHTKEELDPFETLVGGLSWCIGYIKPDYNREICYSEEMTLGQKISVSEKIIICLNQMKYPISLWPQQIQGMDYHAMIEVLMWLKTKIDDIRNSQIPVESLAARQVFMDEFVFDEDDKPPEKHTKEWYSGKPHVSMSFKSAPSESTMDNSSILLPCDAQSIVSFSFFMSNYMFQHDNSHTDDSFQRSDSQEYSENYETTTSSNMTDTIPSLTEIQSGFSLDESISQSTDIIQLIRSKQMCVDHLQRLQRKEERRLRQLSEYKKRYFRLQDYYRQADSSIQSMIENENNEETAAKLQEMKSLMKVLESLNLQRNNNRLTNQNELSILRRQLESHRIMAEHDRQQYSIIVGIDEKVSASLRTLLDIYRLNNVDILRSQCFLERIPSKSELLFFENEIAELRSLVTEESVQLSQHHDVMNSLRNCVDSRQRQILFLQSLSDTLQNDRQFVLQHQQVVVNQINVAIQNLCHLLQQYNIELKKKNRVLRAETANQTSVMEKRRMHSKMLQLFRSECESNKELLKRLRDLQNRG